MTIESKNGYIIISTTVNGYLVTEKYLYYSMNESVKMFKEKYNLK